MVDKESRAAGGGDNTRDLQLWMGRSNNFAEENQLWKEEQARTLSFSCEVCKISLLQEK